MGCFNSSEESEITFAREKTVLQSKQHNFDCNVLTEIWSRNKNIFANECSCVKRSIFQLSCRETESLLIIWVTGVKSTYIMGADRHVLPTGGLLSEKIMENVFAPRLKIKKKQKKNKNLGQRPDHFRHWIKNGLLAQPVCSAHGPVLMLAYWFWRWIFVVTTGTSTH